MKKRENYIYILLCIIIIGISFQFITLFFVMNPDALFWSDSKHYYAIASNLADGKSFSTLETEDNVRRSPGYPFILSLMMRMVGKSVLRLRLFHMVFFPIFIFTLYKLGALWKGRWTGLICALFGVFYPLFIYTPLALYPESFLLYLFPGIFILMFLLRKKMSYGLLFLLSSLIALAVMIRPTCLYLLIIAFLYLTQRNKDRFQLKKLIAIGVLLSFIPLVSATGWIVRNKIVHDRFIFSRTASDLLTRYNENVTWREKNVPLPMEIERRLLLASNSAERNEICLDELKKFVISHPFKTLSIAFMRCLDLWNPIPTTQIAHGFAQLKYKIIIAIPYMFLLILGFFAISTERKDVFVKYLVVTMMVNTVINGFMAISVRYRLMTDFAFILPASLIIERFLTRLKEKFKHETNIER